MRLSGSTSQPSDTKAFDDVVDVTIVGYGPVGATLAVLLAQRGWRVVVLERWAEPYPMPRAVHFDHEAGRILQSCGIGRRSPRSASPPTSTSSRTPPASRWCVSGVSATACPAGHSHPCSPSPSWRRCCSNVWRAPRDRGTPGYPGDRHRRRRHRSHRARRTRRHRAGRERRPAAADDGRGAARSYPLRRRLRRRQQHRAQPARPRDDRPRLLLRLAHRRRDLRRAPHL